MVSELDDAFSELKAARAEVLGYVESVLLNGKKVEAVVSEITADEVLISGGIAQQGGFHVQISQRSVSEPPRKGDPIECRGQELQVASVNDINGVTYDITAADLAAENR